MITEKITTIVFGNGFINLSQTNRKKAVKKLKKVLDKFEDCSWDEDDYIDTVKKVSKLFVVGLKRVSENVFEDIEFDDGMTIVNEDNQLSQEVLVLDYI